MSAVAPESHVTLHYRMALLAQGEERVLVDTFGGLPATLLMGVGQWSPPLEHRLLGLEEGESARFELGAPEACADRLPGIAELAEQLEGASVRLDVRILGVL